MLNLDKNAKNCLDDPILLRNSTQKAKDSNPRSSSATSKLKNLLVNASQRISGANKTWGISSPTA